MPKPTLRPDEKLLAEGRANKWQTFGSKGGWLFLTNQRIIFIAHAFNVGSKFDEIPLDQIVVSGNSFKFKITSNLVSFNIVIETKSKTEKFVVTRKQKNMWIEKIGSALRAYVKQNITVPKSDCEYRSSPTIAVPESTDAAAVISQIKVVNCKGCGAFVVVMGGVARCEYCGSPTVG
jgi:hypothetical protein